ncbi:MAG: thylakoid membrane photosystem I accumulation factor [Cyanobacteriota bacterium]
MRRAFHALTALLLLAGMLLPGARPAGAALATNSYDGNIYALYAGNGSLVPPRSRLDQSLAAHRTAVIIYYLDDCADCKQFSAVVSDLQRSWGNAIDLMPLVTDPLQGRPDRGTTDPAHYWQGSVPQVVVIDPNGQVVFDGAGQVPVGRLNQAISQATGIALPEGAADENDRMVSINELNSEVRSR